MLQKYTAVPNPKPHDKRIKKAALQKSDLIFYLFLSAELDIDCPAEERSCPKPCTVLQAAKAKTADAIKQCIKIRIIPPSCALSAPCSRFHKRSGIWRNRLHSKVLLLNLYEPQNNEKTQKKWPGMSVRGEEETFRIMNFKKVRLRGDKPTDNLANKTDREKESSKPPRYFCRFLITPLKRHIRTKISPITKPTTLIRA